MDDVARDAVRRLALGTLSEAQSVTQVQNSLSNWGATFNVTATLPDPGEFAAVVEISVPIADVAFIDHLDLFTSGNLRTRIAMSTEQ